MEKNKKNSKQEEMQTKINKQKQKMLDAHKQAEMDISKDADFSIHSPNDDLDEEESVKLNADKNAIA